MGHWGVRSYENDEAADALDEGFQRVHGDAYEELMDDRNPLTPEQIHRKLANPGDAGGGGRSPSEKWWTSLGRLG